MVDRSAPRAKRKPGPKTLLTPEFIEAICVHLRAGHYRATAAKLVGIVPETLSEWMAMEQPIHDQLRKAVHLAEAEAEQTQLAKIVDSVEPADAKWYLARKHPNRWAETRRVDVSGRLDMGLRLNADALKDPAARAAVLTLTEALFTDSDPEPHTPGQDSK